MRAITVRRPFGDAIVRGPKRIENRKTNLGARPGEWIAIHQSASSYAEPGDRNAIVRNPVLIERFDAEMRLRWPAYDADPKLRQGPAGIVGVALVDRVAPYHTLAHDRWAIPEHDHCIVFSRVVALEEALPAQGALGLWKLYHWHEAILLGAIARDDERIAREAAAAGAAGSTS